MLLASLSPWRHVLLVLVEVVLASLQKDVHLVSQLLLSSRIQGLGREEGEYELEQEAVFVLWHEVTRPMNVGMGGGILDLLLVWWKLERGGKRGKHQSLKSTHVRQHELKIVLHCLERHSLLQWNEEW